MMDYIEQEMFVQGTNYNHQEVGNDIGAQDLEDFKRDFLGWHNPVFRVKYNNEKIYHTRRN